MRSSGEPSWFEHRHAVPLTGREPVLGRLQDRLRKRGPGWGWLTLRGPAGSGVSRLLREAGRLISEAGAPAPLHVHPLRDSRRALEALRQVMRPFFPGPSRLAVQRQIATLLPVGRAQQAALAQWLSGHGLLSRGARLDPRLVARLLGRVCATAPLLVDEVGDLDEASLEVLRVGLHAGGPDVIAGSTNEAWCSDEGTTWWLEPLGASQSELLLRRWLRHPATARRLAGALADTCGGWPGRLVGAVRELGRLGYLVKERRGVVFVRVPDRWPDGLRRADAFHEHLRKGDEHSRRILDMAALHGGPASVGVLAEAAEASHDFVERLLHEAVAARGGSAPDRFFAHRAARDRYLERMSASRRMRGVERLEKMLTEAGPAASQSLADRLSGIRISMYAGDLESTAAAVCDLLHRRVAVQDFEPWATEILADVARALLSSSSSPCPSDVVRSAAAHVGHLLFDLGQRAQARALYRRLGTGDVGSRALFLLAEARRGTTLEARATLEAAASDLRQQQDGQVFAAWALLAESRSAAGAHEAAREAWRRAALTLPPLDLLGRARWHEGLATCASSRSNLRLAGAHLRRAIQFRRALGDFGGLASSLERLSEAEVARDRVAQAIEPLTRAARVYALWGARSPAAHVRHKLGCVLLGLSDYDRALEELKRALDLADVRQDRALLPDLHLALADAYRGCGDIHGERSHGHEALKLSHLSVLRLRAAAVVARADLSSGLPGAAATLHGLEQDLREADCVYDADRARAVLFHAHLIADDPGGAEALMPLGTARAMRAYAAARLDLSEGRHDAACAAFRSLGSNASLPVDLRAACYTHLAEGLHESGRQGAAREAAVAASALLEVRHRSRAHDVRLHDALARVFGGVGEAGRAEGHRSAAQRQAAGSSSGRRAG